MAFVSLTLSHLPVFRDSCQSFPTLFSSTLFSSLSSILFRASILDCLRALLSHPHFVTLALCLPSTPGPTQTASIWIWCWRASLIACKLTSVCISTDSFSNPVQPLKVPVQDVYGRCLGDVTIDVFFFWCSTLKARLVLYEWHWHGGGDEYVSRVPSGRYKPAPQPPPVWCCFVLRGSKTWVYEVSVINSISLQSAEAILFSDWLGWLWWC